MTSTFSIQSKRSPIIYYGGTRLILSFWTFTTHQLNLVCIWCEKEDGSVTATVFDSDVSYEIQRSLNMQHSPVACPLLLKLR